MLRSSICILTGLLIIVAALLLEPYVRPVEGFQTLPEGPLIIYGIVIYSSLNTIAKNLPFIHSNFNAIMTLRPSGDSISLDTDVNELRFDPYERQSDMTEKLYYFSLSQPILTTPTQELVSLLNDVSTQYLGGPNKLGFLMAPEGSTMGKTYPTVNVPAPAASTEPSFTEPSFTEPSFTEPSFTEPAPTEPAPTEPAPTEPAPTEPASATTLEGFFSKPLTR